MKRGILLTFCTMFLAVSLLMVLYSVSRYSINMSAAVTPASGFGQLGADSDAFSYGLKSICENEAVNVYLEGDNVVFEENLSSSRNIIPDLSRFSAFASAYSKSNLSVYLSEAGEPILYLPQVSAQMRHPPEGVSFVFQDSSGSVGNLSGYEFYFIYNGTTPSANWVTATEVLQNDPDALYFHVGFQGNTGVVSETKYLAKHGSSQLRLLDALNHSLVTVVISSPGSVVLSYSSDMYLKSVLRLNSSTKIELGSSIFNASVFGTSSTGRVYLSES